MTTRRLRPLPVHELTDEQRTMYDAILAGPRTGTLTQPDGSLRGPFDPMLRSPLVGAPLQQVGAALRHAVSLPADLRELLILRCAVFAGCEFEWHVHRPLAESAGLTAEVIETLRSGEPVRSGDPRLDHAVRAADELLSTRTLSQSSYDQLLDLIGEQQLVEVIMLLGYYQTLAMLLNALAITS